VSGLRSLIREFGGLYGSRSFARKYPHITALRREAERMAAVQRECLGWISGDCECFEGRCEWETQPEGEAA
jgi:hypothetical protein